MAELGADSAAEVTIATRTDPAGVPMIALAGELDSSNAASLEAAVASVTSQHLDRLIFDLSALRFMDSAGISVLIGAAAKVDAVELRDPSQVVRRVIELTGLTDVLSVKPR
jgi:anti-sigma B factor antagonist